MFFEKAVPEEARDAYRRDAWSGVLGGIYTGAIFPFIGFIARDKLDASVGLISLMTAAPFIGNMLALFYANAVEGRQKMPHVAWSQVFARALFLFAIFATTPMVFAMLVTVVLMAATVISPAYAAILKEIYPDATRGRIMAYIRVGLAFTTFISTQLAGRVLQVADFRYIFMAGGVFGMASALTFGTIKTSPVDPEDPDNHRISMLPFLRNTLSIFREHREYTWFAVSVFVYGFGNLMVMPLYPVYQVDRLHITATQVAILANTATVFWMLSYPYWGKYVDVRSPLKAVIINVLLTIFIPLAYFLATDVWMLVPAAVLAGITMGGVELAYFNTVLYFAKEGRESHYQALHSFLLGIRGTVAPFVGATLVSIFAAHSIDMKYVFLIAACLMVVGAGLQIIGVRGKEQDAPGIGE